MKKFFVAAAAVCGSLFAGQAIASTANPSSEAVNTPAPTTVNHPDWSRQAVIYEVNVRQFTPEGPSAP